MKFATLAQLYVMIRRLLNVISKKNLLLPFGYFWHFDWANFFAKLKKIVVAKWSPILVLAFTAFTAFTFGWCLYCASISHYKDVSNEL